MPFHFCPQCGTKLQPDFKFCPSCGEKLPSHVDKSDQVSLRPSLSLSPPKRDEAVVKSSLAPLSSTQGQRPLQSLLLS
uniref:Zinc-ribbon domain-containing protein n=1 Tax=Cyclopterus lumpus TaxID=8103 RepID=A0A8C3AXR9_CYCLU